MLSPDKLNYDTPLYLESITHQDEAKDRGIIIVCSKRLAIQWIDITTIEEYPEAYDEFIDWREFKGRDRCWIEYGNRNTIVLASFKELTKYWEFYLTNVRDVGSYQVPHVIRNNYGINK